MNTAIHTATGTTRAQCTAAVAEELPQPPGLEGTVADFVLTGPCPEHVTSASPLGLENMREAVQGTGSKLIERSA